MVSFHNALNIRWSQNLFSSLADGGVWGVPRSGLIFQKRDDKLILTERMPFAEDMPPTKEKFAMQQEADYKEIKRVFEMAGITVEREDED